MPSAKPFPLYEQLATESKSLNKRMANDRLGVTASQLGPENRKLLFFLILHHTATHGVPVPIPYGGSLFNGGRGLTIPIDNLPNELRDIIECFVTKVRSVKA